MYVVIIHFGELSCIPLDWLYIYMYLTNHHSFFHHFFFNMWLSHRQLFRLPKFTILYQIFRMQETTYQQTNTRIFLENMISFFRRFLLKRVLIKFSFFLNYRQIWNRNASLFYWKRNNIPKKKGENDSWRIAKALSDLGHLFLLGWMILVTFLKLDLIMDASPQKHARWHRDP